MRETRLTSDEISTMCSSLAMLLGSGVQPEEALEFLCEDAQTQAPPLQDVLRKLHAAMAGGQSFTQAVEQESSLPMYLRRMVAVGETSGSTEGVLHRLAVYYAQLGQLTQRIRSAVIYPTVLLLVMGGILLFMLLRVLPVFTNVYRTLSGGLTQGSDFYVTFAQFAGWVSFCLVAVFGAGLLVTWMLYHHGKHHDAINRFLAKWYFTKDAVYQQALAQFTTALTIYTASAVDLQTAVEEAARVVENPVAAKKMQLCLEQMQQGRTFVQAAQAAELYSSLNTKLLASGVASGAFEQALDDLSQRQWTCAQDRTEVLVSTIEPALAAILTVCVGLLLVAVMLPLIGIMSSIG